MNNERFSVILTYLLEMMKEEDLILEKNYTVRAVSDINDYVYVSYRVSVFLMVNGLELLVMLYLSTQNILLITLLRCYQITQ